MKNQLTDSKIRALKAKETRYEIWQPISGRGGSSIGIRVWPSGKKVFIFRTIKNKVRTYYTIGEYPRLTLAEALAFYPDDEKESSSSLATISDLFRNTSQTRNEPINAAGKRKKID
ncbi:hypothetical protein CEW81_18170 [Kluyvera genomosp. 3]|uniref:Integrase DNA-binding domain-containing protein n=1 Tax=Kluyvera genomosp. 3 TaxID=2774055 RepID=A0A248KJC0_9ENTR|nr:hypothetical protein CEW81_18170 [Kluyvera genomosp. 3]